MANRPAGWFTGHEEGFVKRRWLALLALLIGLPIVLVLAWYHGDRGKQRIRGTELVIISLLFLTGGGIFWLYDRGREDDSERVTAQDAAPAASHQIAVPAPDAKSIAVLPFADMSPAKDQEYMSDGIAEELLNLLAKVPELKVIARTSSFAFKGKDIKVEDIARELNVAHVLEGSVRTSGTQLRITAQLIRTADSTHLWSETYDRTLDDIFAVQDEIAVAVVEELKIKLLGAAPMAQATDPKAYALFLRAREVARLLTEASLEEAIPLYQQALKIDPAYPAACVGLAYAYSAQAYLSLRPAD